MPVADPGVSRAGGRAAAPRPPSVRPVGGEQPGRGRPRSRRRPRTGASASAGAEHRVGAQRGRPPRASPPARVALPEHPAGQHDEPDVAPGLGDAPAGAGARRPPRPARRSGGPRRRCPDRAGRSRPRWSCGRTVGAEQVGLHRVDDALGLALDQHPARGRAHAEVALDGAAGTVAGRPRSGRRWSRSRRRRRAPARRRSAPSSACAAGRPRPAWPPARAGGTGARPPDRARRARAAGTARRARRGPGPGTISPRPRQHVVAGHARCARWRAAAPSASSRAVGVAGEHDRVADRGPGPAGPRCAAARPGRRRRRRRAAAPRRAGRCAASARRRVPAGPACTCTTCAPAEHGHPVPRLGRRSAARRRPRPAAARRRPTSRPAAPARAAPTGRPPTPPARRRPCR